MIEKKLVQEINSLDSPELKEIIIQDNTFKKKEKSILKVKDIVDVLKIFSPGTSMRTALDDMMRARMGALIVINKEELSGVVEGGFKVDCDFSSQRLVELAKMDGAIILSQDLKKILYANTLLVPKIGMKTKETGTRHKAAERTAKQTKTIVVAVSERKNKITLYWEDEKYVLEESSEILRRATETLQILEKEKEVFDDLMVHLNVLEITNLATSSDICNVLQRMGIIRKISDMVKRYLIELGKEGVIVSMRLKELTKNLNNEREMILKDYFGEKAGNADEILKGMNFDFLLEISNISRMLFEELHDKPVSSKGFRILRKTDLLEKDMHIIINYFGTLDKIFNANKEDFTKVLKNENLVDNLMQDLENLREKIIAGKKI